MYVLMKDMCGESDPKFLAKKYLSEFDTQSSGYLIKNKNPYGWIPQMQKLRSCC